MRVFFYYNLAASVIQTFGGQLKFEPCSTHIHACKIEHCVDIKLF